MRKPTPRLRVIPSVARNLGFHPTPRPSYRQKAGILVPVPPWIRQYYDRVYGDAIFIPLMRPYREQWDILVITPANEAWSGRPKNRWIYAEVVNDNVVRMCSEP